MPLMMASHFFVFSATMIESKLVFLNAALTPICAATAFPMSMSEPTKVEPWSDSSGGYVASVQKTILPAALIAGGGATDAAATAAAMPAVAIAATKVASVRFLIEVLSYSWSGTTVGGVG